MSFWKRGVHVLVFKLMIKIPRKMHLFSIRCSLTSWKITFYASNIIISPVTISYALKGQWIFIKICLVLLIFLKAWNFKIQKTLFPSWILQSTKMIKMKSNFRIWYISSFLKKLTITFFFLSYLPIIVYSYLKTNIWYLPI